MSYALCVIYESAKRLMLRQIDIYLTLLHPLISLSQILIAEDSMFVSLPHNSCTMLKPNLQCDGIWRRGLWEVIRIRLDYEGGALITGFRSL